jgi:hypothetical protein
LQTPGTSEFGIGLEVSDEKYGICLKRVLLR